MRNFLRLFSLPNFKITSTINLSSLLYYSDEKRLSEHLRFCFANNEKLMKYLSTSLNSGVRGRFLYLAEMFSIFIDQYIN